MTISQTQIVDILYKKLSGVSKTDTSTAKSPANEANASPQLTPGSTVWQQDYYIPSVTTLPVSNTIVGSSTIVTVYRQSLNSTLQSTSLSESESQETWTTGLTNWIPPQFGAGYQLKLYAGPPGSSTPENFTNLPVGGSGNNDSWYFDYIAGIVNFADTNVPTAVANTSNVVYVEGARYTGTTGISNYGNLVVGNISINGNTITGNTGVTFSGNITSANVITNSFFYANGAPIVFSNYGNANVASFLSTYTGNIDATNITATGNISATYFLGNATYLTGLPTTYANANVVSLLSNFGSNIIATTGNITAGNVIATFYGNTYVDVITPLQTNVTIFNSNTAIGLPVGPNVARPSPIAGYFRYNSTTSTVEYANGTAWVPLTNTITDQLITPDGVSQTYTLNQATTAAGIIVSINGTVQRPGVAYTVAGTQITFTETPLTSDIVDIRFIASTLSTVSLDASIIDTANVSVGTTTTIVDSFSTTAYRSVQYTISSTNPYDSQFADIMVLQNNGTVVINTYGVLNTGTNTIAYTANISGNVVNLLATGTTAANQLRIQKTYFNV